MLFITVLYSAVTVYVMLSRSYVKLSVVLWKRTVLQTEGTGVRHHLLDHLGAYG
jgi:hypothetical protein